jgi:hypothetical protein
MESLTIYPNDIKQLEKVKELLNELGIPFKSKSAVLSEQLAKSIERGLNQSHQNDLITLEDFKKKFSF